MAEFYLYADESGTLHKSDYISFCGYLTYQREWERISLEWNSCRLAWDVPPIRMSAVMYPERDKSGEWPAVQKKWGDVWERKRKEMLSEFARIIHSSFAVCVGASVDAEYFRSMPDSKFKQEMKDPLYMAFHTVVMNSIEAIDRLTNERSISIVVDDDQEFAMSCYRVLNDLRAEFPDKVGKKIGNS
jgi:hypothetical protein